MRTLLEHPSSSFPLLLVLLVGCAGPLTMNNIQFVERGMSPDNLLSMVGREPAKVFTLIAPEDGREYQVQIFPMQIGTATTYSFYTNPQGILVPQTTRYPVSENFAFLFYEESLLFWGFFHEYARSDDQLIRRLAPIIIERWEKEKGK